MKILKISTFLTAFMISLTAFSTPARANVTYGFYNIRNWDETNGAIGGDQFFVTVSDAGVSAEGVNQVIFTFTNTGDEGCSIVDIYFDDGALFGIAALQDLDEAIDGVYGDEGVNFSQLAAPPDLPTAPADLDVVPEFQTTEGFSVDSDPSDVHDWGINPGEYLAILFDLQDGMTYNDVLYALSIPTDVDNGLRIGIRAQDFDAPYLPTSDEGSGDGSEQYINNPAPIPAPGSIILGGIGIGLVGWLRRRRTL